MHDASRRLQDCLADMYEPDWFGKEEMDTLAEVRPGNSLLMHELSLFSLLTVTVSASTSASAQIFNVIFAHEGN